MSIGVLIIAGSAATYASVILQLARARDISVLGSASTAQEGRDMIRRLAPQVVMVDTHLAEPDGLPMFEAPLGAGSGPVIVVTEDSPRGKALAERALALGAAGRPICGGISSLCDSGTLASLVRRAV